MLVWFGQMLSLRIISTVKRIGNQALGLMTQAPVVRTLAVIVAIALAKCRQVGAIIEPLACGGPVDMKKQST